MNSEFLWVGLKPLWRAPFKTKRYWCLGLLVSYRRKGDSCKNVCGFKYFSIRVEEALVVCISIYGGIWEVKGSRKKLRFEGLLHTSGRALQNFRVHL